MQNGNGVSAVTSSPDNSNFWPFGFDNRFMAATVSRKYAKGTGDSKPVVTLINSSDVRAQNGTNSVCSSRSSTAFTLNTRADFPNAFEYSPCKSRSTIRGDGNLSGRAIRSRRLAIVVDLPAPVLPTTAECRATSLFKSRYAGIDSALATRPIDTYVRLSPGA